MLATNTTKQLCSARLPYIAGQSFLLLVHIPILVTPAQLSSGIAWGGVKQLATSNMTSRVAVGVFGGGG